MLKKISIFIIVLSVAFVFVAPIGADPSDVILEQQVELGVPGTFKLLDADQNGKPEGLEFQITLKSYRQGDLIITSNLEAMVDGDWIPVATTVLPYKWDPQNDRVKLIFNLGNIIKQKINGVYRVNIALKEGEWVLPAQVVGFSPEYSWNMFEENENLNVQSLEGKIASSADAKRAAENWAELKQIKLGKFIGVSYNYDAWEVEFQPQRSANKILRFLVNQEGGVRVLNIEKNV